MKSALHSQPLDRSSSASIEVKEREQRAQTNSIPQKTHPLTFSPFSIQESSVSSPIRENLSTHIKRSPDSPEVHHQNSSVCSTTVFSTTKYSKSGGAIDSSSPTRAIRDLNAHDGSKSVVPSVHQQPVTSFDKDHISTSQSNSNNSHFIHVNDKSCNAPSVSNQENLQSNSNHPSFPFTTTNNDASIPPALTNMMTTMMTQMFQHYFSQQQHQIHSELFSATGAFSPCLPPQIFAADVSVHTQSSLASVSPIIKTTMTPSEQGQIVSKETNLHEEVLEKASPHCVKSQQKASSVTDELKSFWKKRGMEERDVEDANASTNSPLHYDENNKTKSPEKAESQKLTSSKTNVDYSSEVKSARFSENCGPIDEPLTFSSPQKSFPLPPIYEGDEEDTSEDAQRARKLSHCSGISFSELSETFSSEEPRKIAKVVISSIVSKELRKSEEREAEKQINIKKKSSAGLKVGFGKNDVFEPDKPDDVSDSEESSPDSRKIDAKYMKLFGHTTSDSPASSEDNFEKQKDQTSSEPQSEVWEDGDTLSSEDPSLYVIGNASLESPSD
eukprot:GDKJ01064554.1.p1 GENE.GDKJ01064554.1~~GDKJ01064554.1.p1  ORF type:complete len:651 (-),score=176.99 GDKJ01064554.1:25-1695(-)